MNLRRYKKLLIGIGLVPAVIAFGFTVYFTFANQADRPFYIPIAGSNQSDETVNRKLGYNLCQSMIQNGQAQILILDPGAETPKLTLIINETGRWDRINPISRHNIGLYLKYLIAEAKVLVSQYLPDGQANPNYSALLPNVQHRLCATCWGVMESGAFVLVDDKAWLSLSDPSGVMTWNDFLTAYSF